MKELILKKWLVVFGSALIATSLVIPRVAYTDAKQLNPSGSKEVEEGIERHQKQHEEKKEREERREKGEIEEPFKVKKSHQEHVPSTEEAAAKGTSR